MSNLTYARNGAAVAVVVTLAAWAYQAVGAPEKQVEQAWSFDMWCLEMQLYPAKRCNARTPEDQQEYQQYRAGPKITGRSSRPIQSAIGTCCSGSTAICLGRQTPPPDNQCNWRPRQVPVSCS